MAIDTTALAAWELDPREMDMFRKHFAPEKTTNVEWEIFLETCRTYRISPMRKQIYLVGRWDSNKSRTVNTPQISIGGLRALALRTGEFEGTTEPEWGDEEGNWYTLWPKRLGAKPYAARIGVYRKNFRTPKWGVAYFHEMAQKKKGGELTHFWADMGIHMLIKCAEADALRGAFEEQCGGLYIHEEMNQADSDQPVITIIPEISDDAEDALKETAASKRPRPAEQREARKPLRADDPAQSWQIDQIRQLCQQLGQEMPTIAPGVRVKDAFTTIDKLKAELKSQNIAKSNPNEQQGMQTNQPQNGTSGSENGSELNPGNNSELSEKAKRNKRINRLYGLAVAKKELAQGATLTVFLMRCSEIVGTAIPTKDDLTDEYMDVIESHLNRIEVKQAS